MAPPPGEAVCAAQDVVLGHQRASTLVVAVFLDTGHPGPHAGAAHRGPAHQPGVERRTTTDYSWGSVGKEKRHVMSPQIPAVYTRKHIGFTG